MQIIILAQGKNKFDVISALVINIIFMILLTQIHVIQSIFYVLSDMYIRLQILWFVWAN